MHATRVSKISTQVALRPQDVGRSNWATEDELSSRQKQYAAEDAFFTLHLLTLLFERTRV